MKDQQIKYLLHRHFRIEHGVTLTNEQLNDINGFYWEHRKESLKQLVLYRFINMCLGTIFLLMFIWFDSNWLDITFSSLFAIYNLTHGLINWVAYKKIKKPNYVPDEQ